MSPGSRAPLDRDARDRLEHRIEDLLEALDDDDLARAKTSLAAIESIGAGHPRADYARAQLCWHQAGAEAALPWLRRSLDGFSEDADVRHAYGCALDELGDDDGKVAQFLRVLELDARTDRRQGVGTRAEIDLVERVAREVLDGLPDEFAEPLRDVPVVLEARPSVDLVREGFDPRALGLFEGAADEARRRTEVQTLPTRIVLYYANLLASYPDEDELREQIEITVLHEIGHFFGLDEDQVADLGLE